MSKQIAKVRFPNIRFGIFSASLIILLLILEHPADYFLMGLKYLLMSCSTFLLTASIVGGLINLATRSKSDLVSRNGVKHDTMTL